MLIIVQDLISIDIHATFVSQAVTFLEIMCAVWVAQC